jgi:hypothetical protein
MILSRNHFALLAITVLALCLRLCGIGFLLPFSHEPDGHIIYQARLLKTGAEPLQDEQRFQSYPLFTAMLISWLPAPELAPRPAGPAPLDSELARATAPCLRARIVVAVLSSAIVPATYLLARLFLSAGWSLLAAAFAATSLLDVSFSQQARPHTVESALALFAVLACVRVAKRGDAWSYALAGIAAALATGTLHSGVATLVPLAIAHGMRGRIEGPRRHWKLVFPTIALVACVVLFYPFMFSGSRAPSDTHIDWENGLIVQAEHVVALSDFKGQGFLQMAVDLWYYEPTFIALGALAILVWLRERFTRHGMSTRAAEAARRRRRDLTVILAFVLPYAILVGLYRHFFERFAIPLLPYLAVLAAYGVSRTVVLIAGANATRWRTRAIACAAILIVLALPAYASARLVTARSAPDTITQAARWIAANVPTGERVFVFPGLDLPLFQDDEALDRNLQRYPYDRSYPRITYWFRQQVHLREQREAAPPRFKLFWIQGERLDAANDEHLDRSLRALEPDWLVLDECGSESRDNVKCLTRRAAARIGHLVARFSPYAPGDERTLPVQYQDDTPQQPGEHFAHRALHARATGGVVEIYQMDR